MTKTAVLFFMLISFGTFAQSEVLNDSRIALKAGSSKELAKHFASSVDIKIDGASNSYSRTQAEFVLKDFFRKNAPVDFEYVHQGASREGLKYAIGKYSCQNTSFRVYLLIKENKGSYTIDTIDFSEEN